MPRSFVTLFLLLACFASTCNGAERLDARLLIERAWLKRQKIPEHAVASFRFKRDAGRLPVRDLDDVLSLGDGTRLEEVKTTTTAQGTKLIKMQEIFQDRTVSDGVVTVETDTDGAHVLDASGTVYRNIGLDIDLHNDLDPQQALTICLAHNSDEDLRDEISYEKVEAQVLFDDQDNPYLANLVQYLVLREGEERRPTCILDARDSHVAMSWDALDTCTECSATGTGGNLQIGKIRYGQLRRCLELRREGDVCYMENKYVRVIDNNHTEAEKDDEDVDLEVATYDCRETEDHVNGAYSPLLDALFYGTVVGRMYEDWYNITALGDIITFRVHYGVNVSNAFWNGHECQFGDGGDSYYPMVSLDIVSHEVAHGITEKNSNLYYFQQWGGINEAFSDMAGEAAEAYLTEADWMTGVDISKTGTPLRYFEYPEVDNSSISHVDNYTEFLDPHHGSGVYNRAFYLLVHEYGLPIKEVFHVFLHANQMYWHHVSTYATAACDVVRSAYDLGQDGSKFRQAFRDVGLETCDVQDHILGLRMKRAYEDITVSKHVSPFFLLGIPGEFSELVTVNASSLQGDVYIIVSNRTWGAEEEEEDNVYVYAEGMSSVQFELPINSSTQVSVALSTDSEKPLTDVTVQADYKCVENYTPNDNEYISYYIFFLWREYCDKREEESEEDDQDGDTDEESAEHEDDDEETDDGQYESQENETVFTTPGQTTYGDEQFTHSEENVITTERQPTQAEENVITTEGQSTQAEEYVTTTERQSTQAEEYVTTTEGQSTQAEEYVTTTEEQSTQAEEYTPVFQMQQQYQELEDVLIITDFLAIEKHEESYFEKLYRNFK